MTLAIQVTGDGLKRFVQLSSTLGETKTKAVYSRAINDTGAKMATPTGRALADQSGLPRATGRKALKSRTRSTPATLAFTINVKGGDVRLKYFKPRETDAGVSAAPRNQRTIYVGSFMRAGWWPDRVDKPNWNGQVFYLAGKKFRVAKSGVYLPTEATTGQTADTFDRGKTMLDVRVTHFLKRLAGGALS